LGNNRVVVDKDGAVIQRNDYYPFGMPFAGNTGPEKQPYKFGDKEFDTMHGLDQYDFEARTLDGAIPRFTTPDPLAEKKPWLSSYHYCSNNPLNRIDPDGKDDYFNSKGFHSKNTSSGSSIYVNIGGKDVLLAQVNLTSQENRQAVANVIGYYTGSADISYYAKGMVPVGDNPRGTVGLKEHAGSIGFAQEGNIWINKEGGKISEHLSDANNLVSTLVHENAHKAAKHAEWGDSTPKLEAETIAYSAQVSHSSYAKTTKEFQYTTLGGFAEILGTSKSSYNSIQKKVTDFNKLLPKNSKYRLEFKADFQSFNIEVVNNKKK